MRSLRTVVPVAQVHPATTVCHFDWTNWARLRTVTQLVTCDVSFSLALEVS